MARWRLWALLLVLVLPAVGGVRLQCDTAKESAMPCCQGGTADCGQPGMTQDCCEMVPATGARLALAAPAALHDDVWQAWSLVPVPGWSSLVAQLPTPAHAQWSAERSRALHALPLLSRTTVLRI